MTIDREEFIEHLRYERMRSEHLEIFRDISDRVDDDTFREVCIGYVASGHGDREALMEDISLLVKEVLYDYALDDEDDMPDDYEFEDAIRHHFRYIRTVYRIGAEDEAKRMMEEVADALDTIHSEPFVDLDKGFLKELEKEIRECLISDNPCAWLGPEERRDASDYGATAGALNMYRSMERHIPDDIKKEFLTLASDPSRLPEFRQFLKENVLDDMDIDLETLLSYNNAIDTCIEDLLDCDICDEDDAHEFMMNEETGTLPYLLEEFTNGFSFLIFLDDIGLHDEAMQLLRDVTDVIDGMIDDNDDVRVSPCLKDVRDRMEASLRNDDVMGWMEEDTAQIHRILFNY